LKDRVYPTYLYSGINDSTRVTNKRIPTEDLVSHPTAPVEEKKKKRWLRRLSCLDQGAGPSALIRDEVPAEVLPEVDAKGCDRAPAAVYILDEDEEEEVPLIRKNSRH
jgi:hypothetical protein